MDILRNKNGMALLITIAVTGVLVVAALELNRRVRNSVVSAASIRDRTTLLCMASSGIDTAMAILAKDKKEAETDSLQEDWANSEKINEVLQDIVFENGKLTIKISDELAKIQVNALVKFPEGRSFNASQPLLWNRFLEVLISRNESVEGIESQTIINSIKDWLDSGDDDAITGLSGAESDYYQSLEQPYSCKNAPFTHINELLLVKGITPELFFGSEQTLGMSNYITIHGMANGRGNTFEYKGKININTAELATLAALLPFQYEELAQSIYDYRLETSDSQYTNPPFSNNNWYNLVPGCSGIEEDIRKNINNNVVFSSDFFRIEAEATLDTMRVGIMTVIKREQDAKTGEWTCKVLTWKIE